MYLKLICVQSKIFKRIKYRYINNKVLESKCSDECIWVKNNGYIFIIFNSVYS